MKCKVCGRSEFVTIAKTNYKRCAWLFSPLHPVRSAPPSNIAATVHLWREHGLDGGAVRT